jgi:long-chain acyl-CoA synthetase
MYPGTHALSMPDKPAVIVAESGETVTYAQMASESAQLARHLRAHGLERGDRVAILMDNHLRYLNVCWAALRSGMYFVPVNWHLTVPEILYILKDSEAKALITNSRDFPVASELRKEIPGLAVLIAVDIELTGYDRYHEVLASQPAGPLEDESEGSDLIYTSGTSGYPKGGFKPLPDNHPAHPDPGPLSGFSLLFGINQESRFLTPGAPLYHAAPQRFAMAITRLGGTNVILQRFEPLAALSAIDTFRVTHSQWVPTMFVRMLRLDETARNQFDLRSHECAIHAAAPCPIPVKEQMIEWWGPIVHEYYGGSEGGAFTYLSSEEWLEHRGSVGRAAIGTLHILDEEGTEVPTGTPGTVFAENGTPLQYLNDAEKTARAHSKQGWATVGDVGYVDEQGYLYLTDRKDNMIISGGVNIYPQEAENVLIQHPKVTDVAVFGIPHSDFGEEVKAVVELVRCDDASDELAVELMEFCKERLAAFKCPRSIDFSHSLPRAPSGKLYKRRLREEYWADHDSLVI